MFSYMPDELHSFYDRIIKELERYFEDHKFISKFDVNNLTETLFQCPPFQINDFRDLMFAVYRNATSNDYVKDDIITMIELKVAVLKKLEQINSEFERIESHSKLEPFDFGI